MSPLPTRTVERAQTGRYTEAPCATGPVRKLAINAGFFAIEVVAMVCFAAPTGFNRVHDETSANPSSAESATVKVDKLFARWDKPDSPGCSLGVSRNGVPIYEHGYGMANLELAVPITSASVFHVASVSKQFTAMSILLLAQRRQVSLDDDVGRYVPGWVDKGSRVTIRHLLTHTSGLRDGFTLQALAPPREDGTDINDAIVNTLAHTRGLNFTPGSEFQYNNSGYALLGFIVKRVSGQSLRAFAETNIFKPLGMTHTHFHDDPTMVIPNRTYGYHQDADGFHVAPHADLGHLVGTTGLLTTAHDLLLWEQNFTDMHVGDPVLMKAMQTPVIPTGWPDKSSYGFGLEIGQYRGLRTIGHGGGDPGYGAYVVRYPDQAFAVAVVCNLDNAGNDVGTLTQSVADIYLADAFAEPGVSKATAPIAHAALSHEQLASKVGIYYDPVSESVGQVFLRDGKLMAGEGISEEGIEITPITANRFVVPDTTIMLEFVPGSSGRPQELHQTGVGPKPVVSKQVGSFVLSNQELRDFTGEYTSPEIEGTYRLAARDPGLVIRIPGKADIMLQPIFRDAFAGAVVGVVRFLRDAGGIVTGFTVNTGGVRRMGFDRIKR